jgi:peptide/nickel transport system permease protein
VVATTVLAALPSFVAALVLIMLFAVDLRWLPALGDGIGFGDRVLHLILPSIALSTTSIAFVARITRVSVREESQREFVQTATARGLSRATVVRSHILRNAAIPIVTVSGVTIASLVALVAVAEEAFHLNGLGAALVSAAGSKDFAVVQAISLIMVGAFVLANTVVDFLYAMLDPRVTLGTAAA